MAPFVAAPGAAQSELIYWLAGNVVSNRLWFLIDSPPATQGDLDALTTGLLAFWAAQVMPVLSSQLELARVRSRDWSADPPPLLSIVDTSVFGGNVSPSYSANVAVVVPFRWPLNSARLKRNKHYVPGIPDDAVELNSVQLAFAEALFDAYVLLIDDAPFFNPSNRWRWSVASAFSGGDQRDEQYLQHCIGPPQPETFVLGQRRKRL